MCAWKSGSPVWVACTSPLTWNVCTAWASAPWKVIANVRVMGWYHSTRIWGR